MYSLTLILIVCLLTGVVFLVSQVAVLHKRSLSNKNEGWPKYIVVMMVAVAGLLIFSLVSPLIFTHKSFNNLLTFSSGTGQIGDTIGGLMNPFIAMAAVIVTGLAFYVQYEANEMQKRTLAEQRTQTQLDNFEKTFFEMLQLHRDNVRELNYTKFGNGDLHRSDGRKVFKVIFREFIECYQEVKKFSNSRNPNDYILPKYQRKLRKVVLPINPQIDIIELAIIDIAYSIVFFGVGIEGINILRYRFHNRYYNSYYKRILRYIKLKPKEENNIRFKNWNFIRSLEVNRFRNIIEGLYTKRSSDDIIFESEEYLYLQSNNYDKYYGGHQHRLGHYFRHLFQSYKYLYKEHLTPEDRYFYGKTLRAQLSTYEQALLFVNSLSSLGMKWEYTPEEIEINKMKFPLRLISEYHLIKNLPGADLNGLRYRTYFPNVNFESEE